MIQIDDILKKHYAEIDEIREKYKTTTVRFLVDSLPSITGLTLVVASSIKLNDITSELAVSLTELSANEESIIANIDKIAITLGGYGIMETVFWGMLAIGIALFGIGLAWYVHRISERNSQRVNEININFSSALSEISHRMLSSINNEMQDIKIMKCKILKIY